MFGDMSLWGSAPPLARHSAIAAALPGPTGAEQSLREASERVLRQPQNRVALVLHLSQLTPPAPRSYHIRIARVLMQDSATRFDGQVFAMRNQDIVLLCHRGEPPGRSSPVMAGNVGLPERAGYDGFAAHPAALPMMLGKLFSADADPAKLTSLWCLERDAPSLLGYLSALSNGPALAAASDEQSDAVLGVAALQGILAKAPLNELITQQIGMRLNSDRGRNLADRLGTAFREMELSLAALSLGSMMTRATADPFLSCHLASGLEARMVAFLAEDFAVGGRLTSAAARAKLPVHINLGVETILSPGFAELSRRAASNGVRLGASISLMQACADLDLMEQVRRVLRLAGAQFILTHVDPLAMTMVNPATLQPDMIKVVWSPALSSGPPVEPGRRSDRLFDGIEPARIILRDATSHQALAWGQAHGIQMFQGAFLDQVQAATRMADCQGAGRCTMRQCGTRASSVGLTGRAGCSNPALLDAEASIAKESLTL